MFTDPLTTQETGRDRKSTAPLTQTAPAQPRPAAGEPSISRGAPAVVLACALVLASLAGGGCETAPEAGGSADAPPDPPAARSPADEDADVEAADDDDPLVADYQAYMQRLEEAADALAQPGNRSNMEIDWLETSRESDSPPTAGGAAVGEGPAEAVVGGHHSRGTTVGGAELDSGQPATDDALPNVSQPLDVTGLDDHASDPPDPASQVATPDASEPGERTDLIDALASQLSSEARIPDADTLRPHLARAALTLADPHRELTESDLAAVPAADRQLILAYQRMFTHLGRSLGGDADADRRELELAAEELVEQLRFDRHLTIRTARLCTRVNGYGIYEPFESTTFVAGRERSAIVYVELDDFASERNSNGRHVVRLRQEIVLYNASDGLAVWRVNPTEIVDESRNQRRDFFLVQVVKLPANLNVGKYLLKITITDEIGESIDEATIPIEFVAQ